MSSDRINYENRLYFGDGTDDGLVNSLEYYLMGNDDCLTTFDYASTQPTNHHQINTFDDTNEIEWETYFEDDTKSIDSDPYPSSLYRHATAARPVPNDNRIPNMSNIGNILNTCPSTNASKLTNHHNSGRPKPDGIPTLQRLLSTNLQIQTCMRLLSSSVDSALLTDKELEKQFRMVFDQLKKHKDQAKHHSSFIPQRISRRPLGLPKLPTILEEPVKVVLLNYFRQIRWNTTWTTKEDEGIRRAVRSQNQRLLFASILADSPNELVVREGFQAIRCIPLERLEENLNDLDWDKIASSFSNYRTGSECKIRWINVLRPTVTNDQAWTADEIDRLLAAVQEYGQKGRWKEIAAKVESKTPWACLAYYQQQYGKRIRSGKWEKHEDKVLVSAVKEIGPNWSDVSELLPGRTSQQCMHRFLKTLDPFIVRGRWSTEEDSCLRAAVKIHGCKDWWLVRNYVPFRTDVQCRERWMNILSPEVDPSEFTVAEDELLREMVEKHGTGKWSFIAKTYFPRRTDNQCLRRWKFIQKSQSITEVAPKAESPKTPVKRPRGRPRKAGDDA